MEDDVSNRTITVLVVLTVIISILSSLSVLNAVSQIEATNAVDRQSSSGEVSLTIEEPSEPAGATGRVAFAIKAPAESEEPNSSGSASDVYMQNKPKDKILLLPD
jgi:hypothetical protein